MNKQNIEELLQDYKNNGCDMDIHAPVIGTGAGRMSAITNVRSGRNVPILLAIQSDKLYVYNDDETASRIGWIAFEQDSLFGTYKKRAPATNTVVSADELIHLIGKRKIHGMLVRNDPPIIEVKISISELIGNSNVTVSADTDTNQSPVQEFSYNTLLESLPEANRENVKARVDYIQRSCKFSLNVERKIIQHFISWFKSHESVGEFRPCFINMHGEVEQAIKHILMGEHLALVGPKGTGKNTFIDHIASLFNVGKYDQPMSRDTDKTDLLGSNIIDEDGSVKMKLSEMLESVKKGFFVNFDEANMARPAVVAVLHPLLDYRGCCEVPGYGKVERHPQTVFFITMNEGDEYAGTQDTNAAFRDRFHDIRFTANTDGMKDVFEKICNLTNEDAGELCKFYKIFHEAVYCDDSEIPEEFLSQRKFIRAGKLFSNGFFDTIADAVQSECVDPISDAEIKSTIENLMLIMST